nr:DEAD/DEAH box helicase family protein [uncultured Rhodopila sp.]
MTALPPLWPHQLAAIDAIREALTRKARPIAAMATGTGKTRTQREIAAKAVTRGRVVIATSRKSLIHDISAALGDLDHGVWYGEKKQIAPIIVSTHASLGTLAKAIDDTYLLLVDEAHNQGECLVEAIEALHPQHMAGVTGTPYTGSGVPLSAFSEVCFRFPAREAIAAGVLAPFAVDYWSGDGEPDTDALCLSWALAQHGPGLVTAAGILDAEDLATRWTRAGVPTLAVHSGQGRKQQNAAKAWVLGGGLRLLAYDSLLNEGVDIPPLRLLIRRAMQSSPVVLTQGVGRVLRIHPSKTEAVRIYDPHARIAQGGMDAAEAVGAYLDVLDGVPDAVSRLYVPKIAVLAEATAVSEVEAFVAALVVAVGATPEPVRIDGFASPDQRKRLRNGYGMVRYLPKSARETVYLLIEVAEGLTGLAVAGLIAALAKVDAASRVSRMSWSKGARKAGRVHGAPVPYRVADVVLPVVSAEAIERLRERKEQPAMTFRRAV